MTKRNINEFRCKNNGILSRFYLPIGVAALFATAYFYSSESKKFVADGLSLCAEIVIPSVFPFMIYSDLLLYLAFSTLRTAKSKSIYVSIALMCGFLCGFPIAAVISSALYGSNVLDKEDCECVCALGSIPSLSFCIGAIGDGMLGQKSLGFLIWSTCALSSIVIFLSTRKRRNSSFNGNIIRQKYNFIESVAKNSVGILKVCGFVTIFSVICGFIKIIIKNSLVVSVLIPFLEVSNACNIISMQELGYIKIPLITFACAISGASVLCQVLSVSDKIGISKRTYLKFKIFQALLAFLISLAIALIFNIT